ncbi:Plant-specific GATA-type zinc finger transcription factor family protein [Heracleum sosnowskyi]|uniref:Plant-specific GATA-type zinc finger transcription factor family protein n=1 Tax=Heracleum sosnowskyi TaxID=360622 RepID=A0AAD8N387_9APIA|nr:Plant-specific GATA-type zinc finger transcription factor family protein [Heracleum sosnowskyi]
MGGYNGMLDGDADADFLNLLPDLPEEDDSFDAQDWESLFQLHVPIPLDIIQATCQNDANSHSNESSGFQAPSPTSVLDSRSSSSRVKSTSTTPELLIPVRTRTKRPRHSTNCRWHLITLPTPNNRMNKKVKEKKKKKITQTSNAIKDKGSCSNQPTGSRICSHCQVTQTPQWRAGPLGPNTLCNACGVRYRAGRLVPEYRPAASPTFVPTVHSNFHRRIVQMRNTSIQESAVSQMNPATYSTQEELFPVPVYSTEAELFPMHVGHVDSKMVPEAFVPEQPPAMSPPIEFVPMSSYLFDHI